MKKYYYTDPLSAAWMAKHFGVEFIDTSIMNWDKKLWKTRDLVRMRHNGYYYIHPASIAILKPQVRDIWCDVTSCGKIYSDGRVTMDGVDQSLEYSDEPIIQRNGIAFMWPECEEV